jgi:hypothetical protein
VDVDRPYLSPHRREIERGVGDQRDLLTRTGEAQATTQWFALAGGGEWAQAIAMTIRAAHANVFEMSGVDGTHKEVGHDVHAFGCGSGLPSRRRCRRFREMGGLDHVHYLAGNGRDRPLRSI